MRVEGQIGFFGGVYELINEKTGELYIGESFNLLRRYAQHEEQLRANKHFNNQMQRAWNRSKPEEWVIRSLIHEEDLSYRKELEANEIAKHWGAPYLLNNVKGKNLGIVHSDRGDILKRNAEAKAFIKATPPPCPTVQTPLELSKGDKIMLNTSNKIVQVEKVRGNGKVRVRFDNGIYSEITRDMIKIGGLQ